MLEVKLGEADSKKATGKGWSNEVEKLSLDLSKGFYFMLIWDIKIGTNYIIGMSSVTFPFSEGTGELASEVLYAALVVGR